jgi:hypothetical protein
MTMRRKTDWTVIGARMVAANRKVAANGDEAMNPGVWGGAAGAGPLSATAHAWVVPLRAVRAAMNRRTALNRGLKVIWVLHLRSTWTRAKLMA